MVERRESNLQMENSNVKQQQRSLKAPSYIVAAGDPVIPLWEDIKLFHIDDKLLDTSKQFVVCGISMMPRGIDDGDNLIADEIAINKDNLKEGQFYIIKVEPDYYLNEQPLYEFKLRCGIIYVGKSNDPEEIIGKLKKMDSQPEIWLDENQANLREKLKKARNIYPDEDLVLSCTYKYGELRYSFHKATAIKYIAKTIIPWQTPDKRILLN